LTTLHNVLYKKSLEQHPFHLVDVSPWPFLTSFAFFQLVFSIVSYFHYYVFAKFYLFLSFVQVVFCIFGWSRDILYEGCCAGFHTRAVQYGLRLGMFLFIVSEIMFFFGLFWAFFHFALAPSVYIGATWPPVGLDIIPPFGFALLGTALLLYSGLTLTVAEKSVRRGWAHFTFNYLSFTIILGIFFIFLQYIEYTHSSFSINDSVYGSIFFMLTGFHGFHVICGLILLCINLARSYSQVDPSYINYYIYFSLGFPTFKDQHIGFTSAAWYWHFVDVVWVFLFLLVYIWGGL
jgi:heme/copper-type cytochrome/quinol oxidase subunit 3